MKNLFVVITCFFIVACTVGPKQVYEGKRRNKNQESILSVEGKHSAIGFHKKLFIEEVDGKSLTDEGAAIAGQAFPYPHEVYILPGQHTVKIVALYGLSYAKSILWFEAEGGKKYIVRSEADGYKSRTWIEDSITKSLVGGIGYGSEYKPPAKEIESEID